MKYPIIAIVGERGTGKSTLMAKLAKDYHDLGAKIFTNFTLIDIPYTRVSLSQLSELPADIHDCILFTDEAQEGADSYKIFSKSATQLGKLATQLRKRHITWIWATQHWLQIAPRLRRQTNYMKLLFKSDGLKDGVCLIKTLKVDGDFVDPEPLRPIELFDGRAYFKYFDTDEVINFE